MGKSPVHGGDARHPTDGLRPQMTEHPPPSEGEPGSIQRARGDDSRDAAPLRHPHHRSVRGNPASQWPSRDPERGHRLRLTAVHRQGVGHLSPPCANSAGRSGSRSSSPRRRGWQLCLSAGVQRRVRAGDRCRRRPVARGRARGHARTWAPPSHQPLPPRHGRRLDSRSAIDRAGAGATGAASVRAGSGWDRRCRCGPGSRPTGAAPRR